MGNHTKNEEKRGQITNTFKGWKNEGGVGHKFYLRQQGEFHQVLTKQEEKHAHFSEIPWIQITPPVG